MTPQTASADVLGTRARRPGAATSSGRGGALPSSLLVVVLLALLAACREKATLVSFPDEYGGVGLELSLVGSWPVVVRTLKDSPAEQVDLRPNDRVLTVNGRSTEDAGLGNVVAWLRGPADSEVTLTVARGDTHITVVLRRSTLRKGDVDYRAR